MPLTTVTGRSIIDNAGVLDTPLKLVTTKNNVKSNKNLVKQFFEGQLSKGHFSVGQFSRRLFSWGLFSRGYFSGHRIIYAFVSNKKMKNFPKVMDRHPLDGELMNRTMKCKGLVSPSGG